MAITQQVTSRVPEQLKLKLELPLEDTIDVFTAARVAKVSTWTIRRWCEEGKVSANRFGKKWRIYRGPLLDAIRASDNSRELIPSKNF